MDESADKRSTIDRKKKLKELLVEAGIVKPEELPRGLEYDQRASDADLIAVAKAKELIQEQGLSIPTALRALTLAKQKRVNLEQALQEIGWRARTVSLDEGRSVKSAFSSTELEGIGVRHVTPGLKAGLKASGLNLKPGASRPLALETADPNTTDPRFQSSTKVPTTGAPNMVPDPAASADIADGVQGYSYNELFAPRPRTPMPPAGGADSARDAVPVSESLYDLNADSQEDTLDGVPIPTAPIVPPPLPPEALGAGPPPIPADWANADLPADPALNMVPPPLPWAPGGMPVDETPLDAAAKLPQEFVSAVKMGDQLFSQSAYEQAEIFYAQAVELLEQTAKDDRTIAELLVKMGRACLQLSEFSRAERYLTRALKIREDLFGREDITVAECLDFLAELFDVQSQYLEAEQFYLSALGIKERVLSPSASEVAKSLKKLVAVSKRRGVQGEDKRSGELLTEAGLLDVGKLEEGLSVAKEKALPVGRALISLNYLTEKDLEAVLMAQLLLREGVIPGYLAVRALRLASEQRLDFEDALREIGLEPTDATAGGAFDLLQTAKQLIRVETQLSFDHPEISPLCVKLGDLYLGHSQYQQAEMLFKRALQIEEKQSHCDNMKLIEILSRLSDLEVRRQQYDAAEQIYVRLLDLWETQDTENVAYSNTLESLATLHYLRGDFKESGRLYQLAINNKERLLGSEHPGVVSALQGRANCYFATKRYADAEKLYRRASQIHEKVHGNNNETAVSLASILGDLFFSQDDFAKALVEYAQALDCLGNCSDPDVSMFLSVLEKAAHCLYQSGDLEKADTYYRHYINTREGSGTANTVDMADALDRYALVLEGLKREQEAENARKWADETRRACAST